MPSENIGLYLQGLVLIFAWLEIRHWVRFVSGRRATIRTLGAPHRLAHDCAGAGNRGLSSSEELTLLSGMPTFLVFVLLLLILRPTAANWPVGLSCAALLLTAGHLLSVGLSIPGPIDLVLEMGAYLLLVAYGLSIKFAHSPTGGLLYFTAGAPVITCLWLFAFSRVLRLATVLPGLFEGLLALLSYLFLGSLYLQRQVASGTYGVVLLFAGVTTGLWVYTFRRSPSRIGSVAASCWAMTAGALAIVGTSKRLAFLSIVPPTLVLLAPVFFFTYLIVSSYLLPKLDRGFEGRVAYRWNITRDRLVTVLLLFCLLGNVLALVSYMTADWFLLIGPGVFAAVLLWRLVSFLFQSDRATARAKVGTDTIQILGIPVWARTEKELVGRLGEMLTDGGRHIVVTPDSLALYRSLFDPEYREILQRADVCVPDGAGVVWAGDFLYEAPILSRIPGVELVETLLNLGREKGFSAYFLGTSPEIISKARESMLAKYPGVKIVGARDGFFTEQEEEEVLAEINRLKPDMVFVGLGVPKQERWIAAHIGKLKTSLMMGVGGTFDVISGDKDRAPVWLQQLGLEWCFRVVLEPVRLKRIAYLPFFVYEVLKEKVQGIPCRGH